MSYRALGLIVFISWIVAAFPAVYDAEIRHLTDGTGPHGVSIMPVPIVATAFFLLLAFGIDAAQDGLGVSLVMWGHAVLVVAAAIGIVRGKQKVAQVKRDQLAADVDVTKTNGSA